MATSVKKKLFFTVFCLASIIQGMYSTYFVSILTTIERIYQIPSRTAGAILCATEIGNIAGSLIVAYYGGRGNKPKWIAACMLLTALAAILSTSPHFLLKKAHANTTSAPIASTTPNGLNSGSHLLTAPSSTTQLNTTSSQLSFFSSNDASTVLLSSSSTTPSIVYPPTTNALSHPKIALSMQDQLCYLNDQSDLRAGSPAVNLTMSKGRNNPPDLADKAAGIPVSLVLVIFFVCLLAIGFGSTAITTLGIPLVDDIVSKEESPLYLGLSIGLRIFGPALGFLLGSFCIQLDASALSVGEQSALLHPADQGAPLNFESDDSLTAVGAWWLGPIMISMPLLLLALPMYYLSWCLKGSGKCKSESGSSDFGGITYQAAEDHDIGGSRDFQTHILAMSGDLDVTSDRTCYSELVDSSSREVLQAAAAGKPSSRFGYNQFGKNLALDRPTLRGESMFADQKEQNRSSHVAADLSDGTSWRSSCLIVNHSGMLDQTRFPSALAGHDGLIEYANELDEDEEDEFMSLSQSKSHRNKSSHCPQSQATVGATSPQAQAITATIGYSTDEQGSVHQALGYPRTSESHGSLSKQDSSSTSEIICNNESGAGKSKNANITSCATSDTGSHSTLKLSSSLSRLIKNRLLMLRVLSAVLHILPIAGFYTFLPKYLSEQFRIAPSSASAVSGLAGILFVGLGAFLGGLIIRWKSIKSRQVSRWIACSALLYTIGMLVLMHFGCPQNKTVHIESSQFAQTDCLTRCGCSPNVYSPVCANGTTYMSPCMAGCKGYTIADNRILFDECGCSPTSTIFRPAAKDQSMPVQASLAPAGPTEPTKGSNDSDARNASTQTDNLEVPVRHSLNLNVATQGHCMHSCTNLKWYIIIFSIFTLVHASCEVGSMMFNLRCVRSGDRTMALGLITFTSSLLGSIPCSILYGTIIDLTCIHWDFHKDPSSGAEVRGACRAYENDTFRYYLHGVTALVMFAAFLVDCVISRRAHEIDLYDDESSIDDLDDRSVIDRKRNSNLELKQSLETI